MSFYKRTIYVYFNIADVTIFLRKFFLWKTWYHQRIDKIDKYLAEQKWGNSFLFHNFQQY